MTRILLYLLMASVLFPGCSGCSKSGRMRRTHVSSAVQPNDEIKNLPAGKTVVQMTKESGVYKIPVQINGVPMDFIFDTGAGLISISNVEASYLYKQGKLTDDDVIGTSDFIDANGNVSAGGIIRLKEVTISNRTIYNINANVVNNSKAPLLFGQSALEKFGNISIDYKNNTITFE
ncbi:MAG: retroviral-like aspartic protease family protein [Williamsia sp.]|nr:retroviral-like aspartic protease family protein [Williamsia sp.]